MAYQHYLTSQISDMLLQFEHVKIRLGIRSTEGWKLVGESYEPDGFICEATGKFGFYAVALEKDGRRIRVSPDVAFTYFGITNILEV